MDIENIVHNILRNMNDQIEEEGHNFKSAIFHFEDIEKRRGLSEFCKCSDSEIIKALNIALSRKYLTERDISGHKFNSLSLTEEGHALAISVKLGKNRSYELSEKSIINNFNFSGDIHGGNNIFGNENSQNIINYINELVKQIDNFDASPEEKEEAKNLLKRVLNNPIISAIVGAAVNIAFQKMGGL